MAKFWPFPAPMVSEVVGNGCKMILTTFYYTLILLKKCSKLHTLGWGWPCSSPGCSSEGQWWPTKIFAFFTLVNLPDHGESGPVHGQISGFLIPIWLHSVLGKNFLKNLVFERFGTEFLVRN